MLLRFDPGNDAAQDLALTAASRAVATHGVIVDAGVDHGMPDEDLSLQGRLRARQVDVLRVAAGADPVELLALARALSHDCTPVPSTPAVQIELVSSLLHAARRSSDGPPPYGVERVGEERRHWRDRRRATAEEWLGRERRRHADRRVTGERRQRLIKRQEHEIAQLMHRLSHAAGTANWAAVLEFSDRLRALAPRVPQVDRRAFAIHVRNHLTRPALDGIVQVALRDPVLQEMAAGVLRWVGLDGADVMLAALCASESAGPRQFLHNALARMPEAFPAVAPLLRSPVWHEARHAAVLLGRQRHPDAVGLLKRQLEHSDVRVRAAVLHSLARFATGDVADALCGALSHPSPATRAAAAEAIGAHGAAALAMPLAAAFAREQDPVVWSAMAQGLAAIGSPDACAALVAAALRRRSLLGREGHPAALRVEAVRALGRVRSASAAAGLARIAREGDGAVRRAALLARGAEMAMRG
ncbi:MAG TPA: HEAT repeat domain-containing protein [Gemmatimonadales bacterium]|nr:HEAT repeat domain-containing protein [Gemmatimonadales bacterium]